MPELTVAICTYGRPTKLERALQAVAQQTILADIEVVVVDDGSADETSDVVERFPFAHLEQHDQNRGLAAARNTALRAARTEWVLFTDDDCLPSPSWAEDILASARQTPQAYAVGGRVTAAPADGIVNAYLRAKSPFAPLEMSLVQKSGFVHRLREYLRRSATSELDHGPRAVVSISGASMAVRRSAALDLGGWDERFVFGGEEEEQFRRAVEAGLEIRFDPRPHVSHDFDDTIADLVTRSYWYGRGSARLHAKHGGVPTLYPAPVLVALGLLVARRHPPAALVAAIVPQALFSVWPRLAIDRRDPVPLVFPYLQLLQEVSSNLGWIAAAATDGRHIRRRFKNRPEAAS